VFCACCCFLVAETFEEKEEEYMYDEGLEDVDVWSSVDKSLLGLVFF